MWKARMYQALPKLAEKYPAARWVFLTLTVKNCEVHELRSTLGEVGEAWRRMLARKQMRDVIGWVKSIEITRGADGSAHPHIHALLLVKSTYFKPGHYVPTVEWVKAWRAALRADYAPVCDIRIVRSRGEQGITGAVAETLKYAVKPADMLADRDWFLEMTRQVFRTRAVASGGVLTGLLRDEAEQSELLLRDEADEADGEDDTAGELVFSWRDAVKHYQRRKAATLVAALPQPAANDSGVAPSKRTARRRVPQLPDRRREQR